MKEKLDWGAMICLLPVGPSLRAQGPEYLRQLASSALSLLAGWVVSHPNMKKMKFWADVRRMSEAGCFNTAMNAHLAPPSPRHLTVLAVGAVHETAQGSQYLECQTSLGTVAIWGSERSRWNIGLVQSEALPFEAVMFCAPGEEQGHTYWVPEETKLFFPAI